MATNPNPDSSSTAADEIIDSSPLAVDSQAEFDSVRPQHRDGPSLTSFNDHLFALKSAVDSGVICYLDRVTSDGYVEGWARDMLRQGPCILQIMQEGKVIAETVANTFRRDLLDAGIGHGHYAFYARVKNAEPGDCDLQVVEKRLGTVISVSGPARHNIPITQGSRRRSAHDLLLQSRWTVDDIARNIRCLQLSENMRSMGALRFVDVTYLFLLSRWMDETGFCHVRELESKSTSPEMFFCHLASYEERSHSPLTLPGPYDGRFPYTVF